MTRVPTLGLRLSAGLARMGETRRVTRRLVGPLLLAMTVGASLGVSSANATERTFGKTNVGAKSEWFGANKKRVNRYELPSPGGTVSKLSVYLATTGNAGVQLLKGVIYSDSSGSPNALLGESEQITFTSTSSAGWYDLKFPSPVKLAAGFYWIGVFTGEQEKVAGYRFDSVTNSRDYNNNTYTSGASNPFGAFTTNSEQMSLYATYTEVASPPPVNTSPPTISGTAQQGQTLTEAQ
jgi:hypothetical protein